MDFLECSTDNTYLVRTVDTEAMMTACKDARDFGRSDSNSAIV